MDSSMQQTHAFTKAKSNDAFTSVNHIAWLLLIQASMTDRITLHPRKKENNGWRCKQLQVNQCDVSYKSFRLFRYDSYICGMLQVQLTCTRYIHQNERTNLNILLICNIYTFTERKQDINYLYFYGIDPTWPLYDGCSNQTRRRQNDCHILLYTQTHTHRHNRKHKKILSAWVLETTREKWQLPWEACRRPSFERWVGFIIIIIIVEEKKKKNQAKRARIFHELHDEWSEKRHSIIISEVKYLYFLNRSKLH